MQGYREKDWKRVNEQRRLFNRLVTEANSPWPSLRRRRARRDLRIDFCYTIRRPTSTIR